MKKISEKEMWHACVIEEYDRMLFWTRLIEAFVEYQRGSDAAIGIGMRNLSGILSRTVRHPEFRNGILNEITDWARANMWKLHVEISNAYADTYHLKRIENLASDMVKTVAELDKMIEGENE